MKIRLISILAAMSVLFAVSCEENPVTPPSRDSEDEEMTGYSEMLQAFDSGKVYDHVVAKADSDVVVFADGTEIDVPHESFLIHDHTETAAPDVVAQPGSSWWSVGGVVTGMRVDAGAVREDAFPVYVWYDKITLQMVLSNRDILSFRSKETESLRWQNIPVVYVDTGGLPVLDKDNYVKGTITVRDPERLYSETEEFTAGMGIRGRGNSTWSFPKKPYKVKLDEKASLLGMPADKEWCLLANYADRTLLRNIVAMRLSEICGFPWTPRMHSVELWFNDRYQGVYTLCEHKKVSSDRVDIETVGEEDNSGDALTGGYYLEIEEAQDETTCWWTKMAVPMMFSDPEEPTREQEAYVKKYFDDFEQTLWDRDYSEDTGYPKYIDVDSFVDYFIVQELTKNVDGNLRKSSFITKERGKKMEMYHLWDFDLTLGNCGYFGSPSGNGPENFWIKDAKWYKHLFEDPAFVEKVQTRWNELYPQFETIPDFIDEQVHILSEAKDRNFEVWSINESVDWVQFPSLGSYDKEVEFLKKFYNDRLKWLNGAIAGL